MKSELENVILRWSLQLDCELICFCEEFINKYSREETLCDKQESKDVLKLAMKSRVMESILNRNPYLNFIESIAECEPSIFVLARVFWISYKKEEVKAKIFWLGLPCRGH